MKDLLRIGKIVNTHALKGEVKMMSFTDRPEERFQKGAHLFICYNKEYLEVEVATHRVHKGIDLVSFTGMQDINLVEKYKNCECFAYKDEELLEEGEYYVDDLIGCQVYDGDKALGEVVDFYDHTYQDILVVEGDQRVLIPYVDAFVKEVDIEQKIIRVSLIEGFVDEN